MRNPMRYSPVDAMRRSDAAERAIGPIRQVDGIDAGITRREQRNCGCKIRNAAGHDLE